MIFCLALNKLPSDNADLFLIDIEIKGKGSGIDIAKELDKKRVPFIYISSITDEQTIRNASDTLPYGFIAKPFEMKDVFIAIEMVKGMIAKGKKNDAIYVSMESGKIRVLLKEINYAKADGNYTHIHTKKRVITLRDNLKAVHQSQLSDPRFYRLHKSYVVNTNWIERIVKKNVYLKNGGELSIGNYKLFIYE
jgi:DNA-binding LytR/AlgR family response regulator